MVILTQARIFISEKWENKSISFASKDDPDGNAFGGCYGSKEREDVFSVSLSDTTCIDGLKSKIEELFSQVKNKYYNFNDELGLQDPAEDFKGYKLQSLYFTCQVVGDENKREIYPLHDFGDERCKFLKVRENVLDEVQKGETRKFNSSTQRIDVVKFEFLQPSAYGFQPTGATVANSSAPEQASGTG